MIASEALETLERFRNKPWEFQQTFETPLKNLPAFVARVVSAGGPLRAGALVIDLVVFEPRSLIDMLTTYSIPPKCERGFSVRAEGRQEVEELLRVVLNDWVDFLFIPEPQTFAIYADHDEFATIYAHTRSDLARVARPLSDDGFKVESDYVRNF